MDEKTQHGSTQHTLKRVLVVGAGAAGMSAAHHLAQHPAQFEITLIDAAPHCGGQAFSIPLDPHSHGASWCNQGVQGGSYIFHHTLAMFHRQGYHADPVELQMSFGKGVDGFWTNVFPTQLIERHQREVKRLVFVLKIMRWLEILFALLPLRIVLKMFFFSDEFINAVVLPMTALFLGTGNATPNVPAIMFERLCTSPTYGMWCPLDKNMVVSRRPPMVVFPNLSEFYASWQKSLGGKGVAVRLSTELVEIIERRDEKVVVRLKKCDEHHQASTIEDYDEIVLCCLADTAKRALGRTASWREKKVLGAARFSEDLTITHTDAEYMKKHYENFYHSNLAVSKTGTVDQSARLEYAQTSFRPMYFTKTYPQDPRKLEMCFDTTHYQSQFPPDVPFEQHVFQTIFLNKARDSALWTNAEIAPDKIIRSDPWHQLCHSWTHYVSVVPWLRFLQGRRRVRFAGSWTLVNAHETAVISGIAAAVDLGAQYPPELERDRFAFLCFRLYYLLAYGKWYQKKFTGGERVREEKTREGEGWGVGWYGSIYTGPGVAAEERTTWREEVQQGKSVENM